ncbi:LIRP-like [Odontomachus brunneus]|uniref:LIRP-like n=1 Tax=Odontomachus brunneus TaxID=486640 RepID=UPI0013F24F54|nr:LIRP-like [Odontomachus brunneus]XP_032691371.1 LIRP-like [Odontomachus brunneus]XP_032691373.1 LIRP-like [Odontomachus brunneus]
MSVYRLSVIVTLVFVAFLAKSGNAQSDQLRSRWPVDVRQRYCGRRLSNILQTVCTGVYNNMFKKNVQQEENKTQQERSLSVDTGTGHNNMFSELEVSEYPLNYERPSLFISGMGATQFINRYHGSRVRKERGIYEECCLNGCTFSELYTYCGPQQ